MAKCTAQLAAAGELPNLQHARALYWYVAHSVIGCAILVDAARLCGCSCLSALEQLLLGFHSRRWERFRTKPFFLLLVPLVHLSLLYTRPLEVECCIGTPKWDMVLERVRRLAFLLFVSGFCIFGDSHNHGYCLLRLPDSRRSAIGLLRPSLPTPPPKGKPAEEQEAQVDVELLHAADAA